MWCVTYSSFHVMRSIVVNKYSILHQGECPSLGFRLNGIHSVTTFTLIDIINKRQTWGLQLLTQQPAATRLTEAAYLPGSMCFHWLSLYVIALVCLWFPCALACACFCLCVCRGASVCNAAANALWLNHELRAMRECCQFSTGEGLIHSVSDAINQIKHPSALLEEFL